jgi:FMN phosphatase YigB (HAD superfamily)
MRIFEHHISSAGLHPEEIVFIDDRQVNVDGAVSAGMSGVLYTTVTDLKKQLSSLGVQES